MTWRPESDPASDASQHPAARVARENAAAAGSQPAIPVMPEPSVDPEAATSPEAPEAAETRPAPADDRPSTSPREGGATQAREASDARTTPRKPQSNLLTAAGWLLAAGLGTAWMASSLRGAPPSPDSSAEIPRAVLARPLGIVPDAVPIEPQTPNQTSSARLDQLESNAVRLRSDLGQRDSELRELRSAVEELTAALAEAADDAAYSARERVLLHEELEAALLLLGTSEADR
jgi:hypothetical protein